MSSEFFYKKIPAAEVDPAKLQAAAEALALVERRLGLPPIMVVWCREITEFEHRMADDLAELNRRYDALRMVAGGRPDLSFKKSDVFADDGDGFGGKVHPFGGGANRIWINSGEPVDRIVFITAHEAQHLADWKAGLFAGLYADPEVRARLERRADEFAREIERELRET